jgi:ornithine cyclodeaminase
MFTTGGFGKVAGFRAYETFKSSKRATEEQIVAAWDTETCMLKGVCVGTRLGAVRTGVLGGIAVAALTLPTASTCALIGCGLQAETQLLGILALRPLKEVRVYCRHKASRGAFAQRVSGKAQVTIIACDSAEDAIEGADIVVLATNASTPVVGATTLFQAAHITTVGPKFQASHELPLDVVAGRLIVSDSPQQIRDQGKRHMLSGHPCANNIRHLGQILSRGRPAKPAQSLYLSAGLAGTEIVALDAMLAHEEGCT